MSELKNATITEVRLSNGDHGLLSAWLTLDYGGSMQNFGGHALYNPNHKTPNYAGLFIWRVLEVVDVSEWSKLVGKTIRVRAGHNGVEAIGHIVNDVWFHPSEELQSLRGYGD